MEAELSNELSAAVPDAHVETTASTFDTSVETSSTSSSPHVGVVSRDSEQPSFEDDAALPPAPTDVRWTDPWGNELASDRRETLPLVPIVTLLPDPPSALAPPRVPVVAGAGTEGPRGFAGNAGQKLWATLASPVFIADIQKLTRRPTLQFQLPLSRWKRLVVAPTERWWRGAAALLLPALAVASMVFVVSLPPPTAKAATPSAPALEIVPLVTTDADGDGVKETVETLRGEWPTALHPGLPGVSDHRGHR